ncbi:GatB/YqeY domain-containing protein [Cadophora sp. DSE1049]|nr:GatB/YqeY domain-containing protein [Cadophora sp. DSE1049]
MMNARPMIRASRLCCRCYATGTSTTPPMLLKIRKDMKTAMQTKDSNRLSVLRALLSQTLNASKTSSPINTDMQMLSLLRKSANAAKAAAEEFKGAGRQDLADKEDLQRAVLEEYVGSVEVLGEGEIRGVVEGVVRGLKNEGDGKELKIGEVMKRVLEGEGGLDGKAVEKGEVARIVREVLKEG